jgi:hypothetical protein
LGAATKAAFVLCRELELQDIPSFAFIQAWLTVTGQITWMRCPASSRTTETISTPATG